MKSTIRHECLKCGAIEYANIAPGDLLRCGTCTMLRVTARHQKDVQDAIDQEAIKKEERKLAKAEKGGKK